MDDDIPSESPDTTSNSRDYLNELERRIADIENRSQLISLSSEAQLRELLKKEIRQRITVRYFAIIIALIVLLYMAYTVAHVMHNIFHFPFILIPQSLAVAMFVAPIVSISAITIMLIIGAFRKFKDEEMLGANTMSLAADAATKPFTG